jgi:hypothetical protein
MMFLLAKLPKRMHHSTHRRCATDYSCVIHPFGLRMAGGRQLSINFLGCSCLTRRVEGVRFDGRIDRSSFC